MNASTQTRSSAPALSFTRERVAGTASGYVMLLVILAGIAAGVLGTSALATDNGGLLAGLAAALGPIIAVFVAWFGWRK